MLVHEYVGILAASKSVSQAGSRSNLPAVCDSPSGLPWEIRDADVVAGLEKERGDLANTHTHTQIGRRRKRETVNKRNRKGKMRRRFGEKRGH